MTDAPTPSSANAPASGYYLCDLARTSREFSIVDVASAEISEVETEPEARSLVLARYPGARLVLSRRRSAMGARGDHGEDATELVVVLAVAVLALDQTWSVVAYVGGTVHGERCVPFSSDVWYDAIDLLGLSKTIADHRAALQAAHASWRPREDPHPYRDRPAGAEWPIGPHGETCADCGLDPRNVLHVAARGEGGASSDRDPGAAV